MPDERKPPDIESTHANMTAYWPLAISVIVAFRELRP